MIHNSLFISSSKWVKKHYKKILQLFTTVFLFTFVCNILNFIYVRDDDWSRIMWHNFYQEDENIDNLFVGSSLVLCDINPTQLDAINGKNNFNLSLPGMRLNASYYAIIEASKRNKIENVFLELFYGVSVGEESEIFSNASVERNWYATDYMNMSIEKVEFMMTMSNNEKYLDTLFPFIRYRKQLFDSTYVIDTIEHKRTEEYKNYLYRTEAEAGVVEYRDKGFLYTTCQVDSDKPDEGQLFAQNEQSASGNLVMTESAKKYLLKILNYCKEEDINLTFIVSPVYNLSGISPENYDAYYGQINDIAKEYGVPFYDFNRCKQKCLDIFYYENYMDELHLNAQGAKIFTSFLWDVVANSYEEKNQYFYNSLEEKIETEQPNIGETSE